MEILQNVLVYSYGILAILVVFLSIKLAKYVDLLDKKTSISGAFIGGVLLAGVTSLPELFTSISATLLIHQKEMVIGNIVGSDLFNSLVLGLVTIMFIKSYKKTKLDKSLIYQLLILLGMTAVTIYAIVVPSAYQPLLGPINFLSLVNIGLYVLAIKIQPKTSDPNEKEESNDTMTVKQIIIRFIICSFLLVGTSIAITYSTDAVAAKLNLGATVAGSLFLAIATSLPEVVSTISLCRMNNFKAGYNNIIGSNTFNYLILSLSEFLSYDGTIYQYMNSQAIWLCLFLVLSTLMLMVVIGVKFLNKENNWTTTIYIICSTLAMSGYILFLFLQNVQF